MKSQLLVYAVVQQSPAHSVLLSLTHQSVLSPLLVTLIQADVYVQTHVVREETARPRSRSTLPIAVGVNVALFSSSLTDGSLSKLDERKALRSIMKPPRTNTTEE